MMNPQPHEIGMARLQGAYEQLDKRLDDLARTMGAGFNRLDARLDSLESSVDAIDFKFGGKFDALNARFDARFDGVQWRMTSLILVTWLTTIATILFKH